MTWYPFAPLTPNYAAGRGPSCEDCGQTFQDSGPATAIRTPNRTFLGTVCATCAGELIHAGRAVHTGPSTVTVPASEEI